MTKVVVAGKLHSSNTLSFGEARGVKFPSAAMKRKTPIELRGEILKRKPLAEHIDESSGSVTSPTRNADGAFSETEKLDSSKAPRYIDTQIQYRVIKNSIKNSLISRKENTKAAVSSGPVGSMNLCAKRQIQNSCLDGVVASDDGKDNINQANNSVKQYRDTTFASMTGIYLPSEKFNGSSVDMDKAFKVVLSCQSESADRIQHDIPQILCPEFTLPGHKIPLDLSLKTNMRLQLSSSVNWFHRLVNRGTLNDIARYQGQTMTCLAAPTSTSQVTNPGIFHSWVHPQSTLPRSAISALTLAGGQTDFLLKRQQAWEDSFRSLYYMFRKKICSIFYVCAEQFVVLFTGSDCAKETTCSSYAYISQSTTHLRSLLKEHDISFSLPLCQSKVEEVTAEDLVELSEIAKHNIGQTRAIETMTGVDSNPQSLLMITGNKNIHGLYEFLLNYRVFLTSLTRDDVPVLYSPVLFENAAFSAPQIRCKEMRRVDYISYKETEPCRGSTPGISYSVEITDAYLPPWIISDICSSMRCNGCDFQASFKTKSTSIGLNVGLGITKDQPVAADEPQKENGSSFGIPNTTLSPHLQSAYLDGLRYSGASYTASLLRVT